MSKTVLNCTKHVNLVKYQTLPTFRTVYTDKKDSLKAAQKITKFGPEYARIEITSKIGITFTTDCIYYRLHFSSLLTCAGSARKR